MFEMEIIIQSLVNEVGLIATCEALSRFYATGSQINIANIKLTSTGKLPKNIKLHINLSCYNVMCIKQQKAVKLFVNWMIEQE